MNFSSYHINNKFNKKKKLSCLACSFTFYSHLIQVLNKTIVYKFANFFTNECIEIQPIYDLENIQSKYACENILKGFFHLQKKNIFINCQILPY